MFKSSHQRLSRIDIAVALDSTASRFCVLFKELEALIKASNGWSHDDSIVLDNVLLSGSNNSYYLTVGESLKHELSLFTSDVVINDRTYLQAPKTDRLDVRACLLAAIVLREIGDILQSSMLAYPAVLTSMRARSYKGVDQLDNLYNSFHKDVSLLVEYQIRNLHFAVKAVSMYAPSLAMLHNTINKALQTASELKPVLISFTQIHNQFVTASHPVSSVSQAYMN